MKSLPKGFKDFPEARREAFMGIKDLKDKGENVVGVFCTYTPTELIYASGAIPVGLCGVDEESIPEAEKHLPRNLCPLIKSSYGHAISDSCPFFYFSDLVVGETTCDGKKKMYELLNDIKPTHVMHLPQGQNKDHAFTYWKAEMLELKKVLEEKFNIEITENDLKQAISERNKERKVILDFFELGKLNPPPITGYGISTLVETLGFTFNRKAHYKELEEQTQALKELYEKELKGTKTDRPRVLLTGCPVGGVREKVIKRIEDLGADVVAFENCGGPKEKRDLVDETIDPIDALTRKYMDIGCSVMTPNPSRFEALDEMVDDYEVDGVIEVILQACHTFNVESFNVKNFVKDKKDKPYICIETDYSKSDEGQLSTRLSAFIEML